MSLIVRVLFGTSEIMAIVKLLDEQTLAPGATGFVQFRCRREVATQQGEHFIIRSYSPVRTIGGGRILDPRPTRHRRFDQSITARLRTTAHGTAQELLRERVSAARDGPRLLLPEPLKVLAWPWRMSLPGAGMNW